LLYLKIQFNKIFEIIDHLKNFARMISYTTTILYAYIFEDNSNSDRKINIIF